MADRIVQPKVKNAQGTYDNLIIQQVANATNAENAILNADTTHSAFTQDSNNVLSVGQEIISKKKLIWSGNKSQTLSQIGYSFNVSIDTTLNIVDGHKYCIEYYVNTSGSTATNRATSTIIINGDAGNVLTGFGGRFTFPDASSGEILNGTGLALIGLYNNKVSLTLAEAFIPSYTGSNNYHYFVSGYTFGVTKIYEIIE